MSPTKWFSHPRPWCAEPMTRDRPDGPWKVTCPSLTGRPGDSALVISHVSESDAKAIAAGANLSAGQSKP
jgi:hypothetical protein